MTDLKIYEITDAVLDALDALEVDEETGEVLNPEILNAVKVDAQVKITSTAKYVSMLECQEEQIKKAIKGMQARLKDRQRRTAWLKAQMLKGMTALGVTKIESPDIEVKIGKLPPSVRVLDEAQIPNEYIKTKTEQIVDIAAIKIALKQGVDVPGVMLITNGQKLNIR